MRNIEGEVKEGRWARRLREVCQKRLYVRVDGGVVLRDLRDDFESAQLRQHRYRFAQGSTEESRLRVVTHLVLKMEAPQSVPPFGEQLRHSVGNVTKTQDRDRFGQAVDGALKNIGERVPHAGAIRSVEGGGIDGGVT